MYARDKIANHHANSRARQPEGVNWFNIARYLADARAMELPLVGGGDHDWNTILTQWGLLQCDTRIAVVLRLGSLARLAGSLRPRRAAGSPRGGLSSRQTDQTVDLSRTTLH